MNIAIHLNPTYAAINTPLHEVWNHAYKEGTKLPTYWELIDALLAINTKVRKIGAGKGELPIYLGIDAEGLDQIKFGNNDQSDSVIEPALINFNRTQDLESLLRLRND